MKLLTKIILCIITIVLIVATVFAWKSESLIRRYTDEYVATLTQDKYKLQFEKANIWYFPLGVELENVRLQAVDSTYINLGQSTVMFECNIDKIGIKNFNILRVLTGADIRFNLLLESPNLTAIGSSEAINAIQLKKSNGDKRPILVKNLTVNQGNINYSTDTLQLEVDFDYEGEDLSSDNLINDLKSSSVATLKNLTYKTANGLNAIEVEKAIFDKKGELNLFNTHLITVPDKYELGHVLGHESTWHDVKIDSVRAFSSGSFFHNDTIKLEKVEIAGLTALMFRDKRLKFPTIPDKPMIKEIINKIKVPMIVDEFSLSNSEITYQEHVVDFEDAGTINFEKLNLSGSNLSTLENDSEMKYQASALLMGEGLLEIEGTVPLGKNKSSYKLSGIIYPHDLKIYNPILNYVAGVHVTSGLVKRSTFSFTYDNIASEGTLEMIYDDLNVKFTNEEGNISKQKLDDKLKNFITNTFVIKSNNEKGDNLRVGKISFERNPKKSFLNYWWKSLLSGIKSSIGMKSEAKKV